MLHEYKLKKPVHVEQFDGSKEMLDRYPISIRADGFGTWYKLLTVEGLHLLYKGDWIVSDNDDWIVSDNDDYLVIEESLFLRNYERCD